MASRLYQALVLATYQISIALGIMLLPVALLAQRAGIPLPIGRLVERLGKAYNELESA